MLEQGRARKSLAEWGELQGSSRDCRLCRVRAVSPEVPPPRSTRTNINSLTTCVIFCAGEVSDRPFHADFSGTHLPAFEDHFPFSPPGTSWSTTSSMTSKQREKLYRYRGSDLESTSSDRSHWLQRQSSLSSQNAVYPPGSLRYSYSRSRSAYGSWRAPLIDPSVRGPHMPHSRSISSTLPSVSEYSSLAPSRASSSVSSNSSSGSRKSPLSTMRRVSQPEVPLIPDRYISLKRELSRTPQLAPQAPAPAWSPALTHAPLSADPAIRAFSVGGGTEPETVPSSLNRATYHPPSSTSGSSHKVTRDLPHQTSIHTATTTATTSLVTRPPPPQPKPAPGHKK